MTTGTISDSQRKAAKIVAITFLLSFAIVVAVNFGIIARVTVADDPAQTARNVLAHETFFRLGIAGNLLYAIGVFVLSAAFFVVLKPVDQTLALLASIGRLLHGITWLLLSVNLFTALRLLGRPEYAEAFSPRQLPALARLFLSGFDQYYVGLLFWSLGGAVGAYLWFRSRYVPRALAFFGVVASEWCAACTVALFIFKDFDKVVNLWFFDVPMVLFEIALSFVLLFRGLRPSSPVALDPTGSA